MITITITIHNQLQSLSYLYFNFKLYKTNPQSQNPHTLLLLFVSLKWEIQLWFMLSRDNETSYTHYKYESLFYFTIITTTSHQWFPHIKIPLPLQIIDVKWVYIHYIPNPYRKCRKNQLIIFLDRLCRNAILWARLGHPVGIEKWV